MLSGETDGNVQILRISDHISADVQSLHHSKFRPGFVTGLNWFPVDNGLFCVAYNDSVVIIDTNNFCVVDTYTFNEHQIYGCDWSRLDKNLIAVAASISTVRMIDVRSGASLQNITVSSPLGVKDHCVTRVLWDASDPDVLYAGDNSGCIHIYDVRSVRQALQIASSDSHLFQTVTCLQSAPNGRDLISCHGMHNKLSLWCFKSKKLVNTNIHFEIPVRRRSKEKANVSGLIRTQLFMKNDLLFTPVSDGSGDVLIHDLTSGALLKTLDPCVYTGTTGRKVNAVAGLLSDFPILFSAGKTGIKVWSVKTDEENVKDPLHKDEWSDDDD